jgi:integrase
LDRKAGRALKAENDRRTKEAEESEREPVLVEWFGLHEARHSFSTFMDHAGISETRADRYMGHSAPGVGAITGISCPGRSLRTRAASTSTSRARLPGRWSR